MKHALRVTLMAAAAVAAPPVVSCAYGRPGGLVQERIQERRQARQEAGEAPAILSLGGRHAAIWRPEHADHAPLILFSHGFGGCETQSTFLTAALAAEGYFVVAPRHEDARCGSSGRARPEERFGDPQGWTSQTYIDRRDDMIAAIEALRESVDYAGQIDFGNIGLLGHSLGGYTVLALAGAWPDWRLPETKAVVALSPYCQPFLEGGGLKAVSAPVQYQGGTRDKGITPAVRKPNGCFDQTGGAAMFIEFEGAGHFAFTDLQQTAHDSMAVYARSFFDARRKDYDDGEWREKRAGVSDLKIK